MDRTQRIDHVLLLLRRAVLAQLEFGFDFGDRDLKSYDVAEHAGSIGLAQTVPLLLVRGLEGWNQVVEHGKQILVSGVCSRIAVDVNRGIVPRGNVFGRDIVRGGNVGVRAMKDGQAMRMLLKVVPVRVGLRDVAPENEVISIFADDDWDVRSEWTVVRARDENHERVGAHESDRAGVVTDAEVLGNIHVFLSPLRGLSLISASPARLTPWAAFFRRFAAQPFINHGCGGTASPRP